MMSGEFASTNSAEAKQAGIDWCTERLEKQ